jgi:hypothetical protein
MFAGSRHRITGVRLSEGAIRVTWEVNGPHEGATSAVTVFGEDGQGVAQIDEVNVPEVPADVTLLLTNVWEIAKVIEA